MSKKGCVMCNRVRLQSSTTAQQTVNQTARTFADFREGYWRGWLPLR